MIDEELQKILNEIIDEQHISSSEKESTILGYIKDGKFDINECSGIEIDYKKDLEARRLLKNYVMYARYGRLAEFKQLYGAEYAKLQAKYY